MARASSQSDPDPSQSSELENDPSAGLHSHDHTFVDPAQIDRLRIEAELLEPLTDAAIEVLRSALQQRSPTMVVDLGSGPGVGTCQLAVAFPAAQVVAADAAIGALDATRTRAERLGLGDRVTTLHLDLATGTEMLPIADVCWGSMAVHHVGNEVELLRSLRGRLSGDGMLSIVEWDRPPSPIGVDDLGRPGLWDRLDNAWRLWFAQMRSGLPDWVPSRPVPDMMVEAGYEVVAAETIEFAFAPPLDDRQRRFGARWLLGARERLQPFAEADDLDALSALLTWTDDDEPTALIDANVAVATSRTLTIGTPRYR